ncbi:MAG: DUF4160 domain-containing protein [Allosphingosinicella sp.]|uniref:DUF4160 domain-containing protein n=1 Tax=Allosphingosinicella sp. TaxID=2823234 RepID=UPI0039549B10
MPVVFRWNGYRFHFYSDEGDPCEPVHIHVRKGRDNAKFWLYPEVTVAYNRGFSSREQSELARVVEQHREEIERVWNDHFA